MNDQIGGVEKYIGSPTGAMITAEYKFINDPQYVWLWGQTRKIIHPIRRPTHHLVETTAKIVANLDRGTQAGFSRSQLEEADNAKSLRDLSLSAGGNLDFGRPTFTNILSPGPIHYYATSIVSPCQSVARFEHRTGNVRVYRFVRTDRVGNIMEVGFAPIVDKDSLKPQEKSPQYHLEDLKLLKKCFGIRDTK